MSCKMKAYDQSKSSEGIIDKEQFRHFGGVFVKEDREAGKVVQKPCLFVRQSRSVQLDSRDAILTCARKPT